MYKTSKWIPLTVLFLILLLLGLLLFADNRPHDCTIRCLWSVSK